MDHFLLLLIFCLARAKQSREGIEDEWVIGSFLRGVGLCQIKINFEAGR